MRSVTRHSPAARPTTTRVAALLHHVNLLCHIGSGLSTPKGCCDVDEPDLSVALDVAQKVAQRFPSRKGGQESSNC